MGTAVSLDVRDHAAPDPAVLAAAMEWLHQVDARFSTYRATSDISLLRAGRAAPADVHRDVRDVLHRCQDLRAETGGAFDHGAGPTLDPSAYVKGWALERAADILRAGGVRRLCLTGGGDVVARGGAWRIGVQHPLDRGAVAAVVLADDLAVATSGTYERGQHIRDPRTGEPPRGVLSVTVTGPDLGIADALSTAAFALGPDGPDFTTTLRDGYEAMTILEDHRVLCTPGFPATEALS